MGRGGRSAALRGPALGPRLRGRSCPKPRSSTPGESWCGKTRNADSFGIILVSSPGPSYGYNADGEVTSQTTTSLAGPSSSSYTYDEAGRLTSWNNGTATTAYGYDGNGNLTQDGAKTYTYDARDELTSDGTTSYAYTARGTPSSESGLSGSIAVSFDAYGDQATAGTRSYTYDALGRLTADTPTAGGAGYQFSYAGSTGMIASDGASTYTWDPSGSVLAGVGAAGGGSGVLALTSAHGDVLGQFGASGTAVSGSQSYDPWGKVTATAGTSQGLLGGQSFTAGTLVLLASGKTVPISSLKVGDKVEAADTKTGKDQPETVTAVLVHHDTDLYNLTVKTSTGTEVIHTTTSHLFWDPATHQWVKAAALHKGEHLKTPNGILATADGGSTPKDHEGWMWDLTVPGNNDHDFYVVAGSVRNAAHHSVDSDGVAAVLVHNCGEDDPDDLTDHARQDAAQIRQL